MEAFWLSFSRFKTCPFLHSIAYFWTNPFSIYVIRSYVSATAVTYNNEKNLQKPFILQKLGSPSWPWPLWFFPITSPTSKKAIVQNLPTNIKRWRSVSHFKWCAIYNFCVCRNQSSFGFEVLKSVLDDLDKLAAYTSYKFFAWGLCYSHL